ncbi:Pleiotropic drug resistance protein 5, partial [Tetrabaena socialis]
MVGKAMRATLVATLLQPSPEVYECFDDVLLLSHGRVVFHGPRTDLLPFFVSLSLAPLPGMTAADFAQAFAASETGRKMAQCVAQAPYTHPLQDLVLHKEPYGLSAPRMWAVTMRREGLLLVRNTQFFIAGISQILFTGFLVSTAFVGLKHRDSNDANLFMSVVFFSLMTIFM